MNKEYILWLPSWYPNEVEPFNGDFIQRHAQAASLENQITVIFFTQFGETVKQKAKVTESINGKLKELTVYVPFEPMGVRFIDRIWYNYQFYRYSAKFLKSYFENNGLPLLVHVHVPVKAGNLALWIKRKFSIPYIVTEHSSTYLQSAGKDFFKRRHRLYQLSVKKIFSEATVVTNVSKALGQKLQQFFPIQELKIIHNVVDTSIFRPEPSRSDLFTYIHISSLTSQKNVFGMLRAFKRLASLTSKWRLLIVGPYNEDIESFIQQEGLEEFIVLLGEVQYKTVADCLNEAHVLVLFSTHENFPCVVIEALCCGVPVVASDVGGISEVVDISNGILVKSEREDQLLQALVRIRKFFNVYNRAHIAVTASNQFSYPVVSNEFDQLYKKCSSRVGQ